MQRIVVLKLDIEMLRQVRQSIACLGELAPRAPRLTATFILTALNGIPGWFRPEGELTDDQIADAFADMLLDGLRRDR